MTVHRFLLLFSFIPVFVSFVGSGDFQNGYQYVGSRVCAECHLAEEIGNQYIHWLRGRHSHAYWRLGGDWAKFLASQREEYKDIREPIEEDRCLKCHSTGYGQDQEVFSPSFYKEEGVGCEACHGPGSSYVKASIMKNHEKFLANGGVIPNEETCRKCHRDDQFIYEDRLQKIHHPVPQRQISKKEIRQ